MMLIKTWLNGIFSVLLHFHNFNFHLQFYLQMGIITTTVVVTHNIFVITLCPTLHCIAILSVPKGKVFSVRVMGLGWKRFWQFFSMGLHDFWKICFFVSQVKRVDQWLINKMIIIFFQIKFRMSTNNEALTDP